MKVLVTGSQGYIGQVLCQQLEAVRFEIKEFDLELGNDITDADEVEDIAKEVDVICHMAAVVGFPMCDANPELAREVNINGTRNVCRTGKRVIFTSALSNYDGVKEIDEQTIVVANTLYARTKLEAEELVLHSRMDNVVLRFGSLYGISSKPRNDLLVNNMCLDAVKNGRLEIFQPEFVRAITNIQDAVSAIMFMLSSTNVSGIYNVVSLNKTKKEIAETISMETGCSVTFIEGKDKENRSYIASNRKIRLLGFDFNSSFEGIIKDMVRNYAVVCDNKSGKEN